MLLIETDPIAVAGLIVATIGVLIAIPAAWGAVRAIKYAKEAPSRKDLERVEGNTLRTSEHLEGVKVDLARVEENTATTSQHLDEVRSHLGRIEKRQHTQHEHDSLQSRLNGISISVIGGFNIKDDGEVQILSTDQTVVFSRIELLNESGTVLFQVSVENDEANPKIFLIEKDTMRHWIEEGTLLETGDVTVYIRIYLYFRSIEHELSRSMNLTCERGRRILMNPQKSAYAMGVTIRADNY